MILRNKFLFITVLLSLVLSACTGLGSEPEIVATIPQAPPLAQVEEAEPLFPQEQPDIKNGAQIFATRCTDCHGEAGNGQGQLVLEGSIPQPPDMTDIELTSLDTPLDWYNTITNGRIENLMPPWKNALTAKERWDVAYYAYTLAYESDTVSYGEQVWADKCGDCDSVNNLINLEEAVKISDASFGNAVDRDDFGNTLARDEIYAVVAYARSLSVKNPESIASVPDLISASESTDVTRGSFTGTVEHGTEGSEIPADTVIQMQYGNAQDNFTYAETTINPDNSYTFEDIPLTTAYNYHVGAVYRDRLYTSTIREGHPPDIEYDQPITIYDLTDDPFVISISAIDMFIDPINVPEMGTGVRITQLIQYSNSSDRMYTTGREIGDGREATLLIQFPVGAIITSDEGNGRYLVITDVENIPDSVIDTYPIIPGDEHEVIVEYFVPYTDGAIIDQPFTNAIDADIRITMPKKLNIATEGYTIDTDANISDTLQVYAGIVTMETDPTLIFEVVGNPFATTSQDEAVVTSDTLFPILLGAVVIIVLAVIGVIIVSNRGDKTSQDVDKLIQQIAELDGMHEHGQINHDVYQKQRQELKAKLSKLMQDNPSTEAN